MAKKVQEKKKKENNIDKLVVSIKDFFNRPAPLIIFLILMVAFLLLYICKFNSDNKIYVGEINNDEVQVASVHYFTNGDMNYFYASPAIYLGEDKKIYSYQIGYYVVDESNDYIEFVTRGSKLEEPLSLSELVDELSAWDFAELADANKYFDKDVIKYLDNLHFVIKAATKEDTTEADIVIDYEVDLTKITR